MKTNKFSLFILLIAFISSSCAQKGTRQVAAFTSAESSYAFNESGQAKITPWGGYWWSMERAEVVLGWEDGKGREQWSEKDVRKFSDCLPEATEECAKTMKKFKEKNATALSPLMKFDLMTKTLLESSGNTVMHTMYSRAAKQEVDKFYIGTNTKHPLWDNRGFAGKCTGWSFANMDYPEPTKTVVIDGVEFKPADIKALLATMYYAAQFFVPDDEKNPAVIGQMFTEANSTQEAYDDVSPQEFVKALRKSIKKGDVIVGDLEPDLGVWNYPIYKYEMKWNLSQDKTKADVVTRIHYANDMVKPDDVFSTSSNRPDLLSRDLEFTLKLPASAGGDLSKATSGNWSASSESRRPDILLLRLEQGWKDSFRDYKGTMMKDEVNTAIFIRTKIKGKWVRVLDYILGQYYK